MIDKNQKLDELISLKTDDRAQKIHDKAAFGNLRGGPDTPQMGHLVNFCKH